MPRNPEQFEALRDVSRQRILTTAMRMFARDGYEKTTVRKIASEAKISQGLMYNYFGNKAELLRAVFQRSMADVQQSFEPLSATDLSAQEQLAGIITGSFEIVRNNAEFWRLSYGLRSQPAVLAEFAADIRGHADAIRTQLTACFAAGANHAPEIKAAILFAQIDGIAQHYLLDPGSYPLDEVVAELLKQYADGTPSRRRERSRTRVKK